MHQEQKETGPGIVVLSPSLQILHMSGQAFALLKPLERTEQNLDPDLSITALLHQYCHDILETMQEHIKVNNWEHFCRYRTLGRLAAHDFAEGLWPA